MDCTWPAQSATKDRDAWNKMISSLLIFLRGHIFPNKKKRRKALNFPKRKVVWLTILQSMLRRKGDWRDVESSSFITSSPALRTAYALRASSCQSCLSVLVLEKRKNAKSLNNIRHWIHRNSVFSSFIASSPALRTAYALRASSCRCCLNVVLQRR